MQKRLQQNIVPILEAYKIGCEKHGEEFMKKRFEQSAAMPEKSELQEMNPT